MPREFSRSDRVGAQMQRELADLLRGSFRDPELGMVTVSQVEVTRDLSLARVFVSFLGGRLEGPQAVRKLSERVPELRHQLGQRMRLRVMPEVRFLHDDSIERGMRMDALLKTLDGPTAEEGLES